MRLLRLVMFSILLSFTCNSEDLPKNWGLDAIRVKEVWKTQLRDRVVRVCVVDTGMDLSHPELKARLCAGENGWDFASRSELSGDSMNHGTHVAGIIAAVAPTACLIPVKWFQDGERQIDDLNQAATDSIKYCVSRGADVINYSGGGNFYEPEKAAIELAGRSGILFVAAAGNEGADLDAGLRAFYPAQLSLQNLVSVTAINRLDQLLVQSNWGKKTVTVAAPGFEIFSTIPRGYGYMTGTSMATPFVTGVAALLLSKYPKLTPGELKAILKTSAKPVPSLSRTVASGGKLDAVRAFEEAEKLTLRKHKIKVK